MVPSLHTWKGGGDLAFLSIPFFLFFPVAVLGYHLLPRRWKAGWLLALSWVFYLSAGPQYAPFLLGAILLSYGTLVCGRPLSL